MTLATVCWHFLVCLGRQWTIIMRQRWFNVCERNVRSYVVRCGRWESSAQRAVQQTANIHLYARMPLAFFLLAFCVVAFVAVYMYVHTLILVVMLLFIICWMKLFHRHHPHHHQSNMAQHMACRLDMLMSLAADKYAQLLLCTIIFYFIFVLFAVIISCWFI